MNDTRKTYEVGYHIIPTVSSENISAEAKKIKDVLAKLKAGIIAEEEPRLVTLAYAMEKVMEHKKTMFDSAYFGWIKFELEPENALVLKKEMEQNDSLLRFLIIRTVREDTRAPRKFLVKKKRKPAVVKKEEKVEKKVKEKASKEEIDKKIEELVVE